MHPNAGNSHKFHSELKVNIALRDNAELERFIKY